MINKENLTKTQEKRIPAPLSQDLINAITSEMKGNRLNKFKESVELISSSLNAGSWLPGASRRANSGFSQGNGIRINGRDSYKNRGLSDLLYSCHYGHGVEDTDKAIVELKDDVLKKYSRGFVLAWMKLCQQKEEAIEYLNDCRPIPVITEIGLSPKVTKTFTEMGLKLDIKSIRPAVIDFFLTPLIGKDGNQVIGRNDKPLFERIYFIKWSKGTLHKRSRFASPNFTHCEACGKAIPSGWFVPLEADDKTSGHSISLWVGTDCAKNIFGVKDVGLDKTKLSDSGADLVPLKTAT